MLLGFIWNQRMKRWDFMEVRPATSEDESFLYELYANTRLEEVTNWGWDERTIDGFLRMQWMAQRQSYQLQYPNLRQQLVLVQAQQAGRVLTCAAERALILVDISLLPEYRGQGIGTKLIQAVQQEAAERRQSVQLSVLHDNPAAKRLYERLGFKVTGDSDTRCQMEWHKE